MKRKKPNPTFGTEWGVPIISLFFGFESMTFDSSDGVDIQISL